MGNELGFLGYVSAAATAFQVLLPCKNASGVATSPTGSPAYTVYNSAGTSVGSGSFSGSDHDSKTGLRRLALDVSALTGVAAGEKYDIYCTYVVGGSTYSKVGNFRTV